MEPRLSPRFMEEEVAVDLPMELPPSRPFTHLEEDHLTEPHPSLQSILPEEEVEDLLMEHQLSPLFTHLEEEEALHMELHLSLPSTLLEEEEVLLMVRRPNLSSHQDRPTRRHHLQGRPTRHLRHQAPPTLPHPVLDPPTLLHQALVLPTVPRRPLALLTLPHPHHRPLVTFSPKTADLPTRLTLDRTSRSSTADGRPSDPAAADRHTLLPPSPPMATLPWSPSMMFTRPALFPPPTPLHLLRPPHQAATELQSP